MKNSPHRHKHQVNKAVREAKKTHPLPQKPSPNVEMAKIVQKRNEKMGDNDHLNEINQKASFEILKLFKQHLERAPKKSKPKHSKRTTTGTIESDGPFPNIRNHKAPKTQKDIQPSLEKGHAISRKVRKNQSNRKAA